MITKQAIRKEVSQSLLKLSVEERVSSSVNICNQLKSLLKSTGSQVVMAYMPTDNEVDIKPFIAECLFQNKTLLLPKIITSSAMEAVEIFSFDNIHEGVYGIFEPTNQEYRHKFIDLVVVPGVAFDSEGNRVGRGKGYYDHFLKKHPESLKVGIGYSRQLVEYIPTQDHDVKMDKVITPGA